ncbi:hypothetical protein EMWEY_00004980 [Eimeria maxima]|uniref:Atg6 BARA domain-containing protein n=1 Tax=Eimeria maxima TaxID=5804 RepID=U6M768_EIMMA|nr:hypothetical protein EMWEY_00004980 [Eimeria maxima]CDJ59881.1 hypothetical protein EMWEY_00004980 [Eimeria maxima]
MESPNSPLQPLPRASFVCENCSRHVVVVLDSSFHSSNTTLQTSKQSKTEVSLAANAEDPLPLQFHCVDEGQFHRSGATTTPLDDGAATCAPLQRPLQHQLQHQLQPPVPSANESCRSPLSSCVPSLYADPADTSGASVSVDEGVGADSGMMYPLCAACLDADIAEVEPSTAHEKRLIRKYERALRRLQRLSTARAQEEVATDAATSTLAQLRQLEEEERKLEAEISVIEASTAQKEAQKRAVVAELAELHMWHAEFWLLYTNHWLRMMRHGEVNCETCFHVRFAVAESNAFYAIFRA